jgi:hypothetical protein
LEDYSDERLIANERNSYKSILLSKYNSYLKSKERYEAYREKVKIEEGMLFRMKQQILYLDDLRRGLDERNRVNKDKLRGLAEGFERKIEKIDEINGNLMKEKVKLQNQKEALANKIREYQHEIEMIKNDSEKSKLILKKLKNYLLYQEL